MALVYLVATSARQKCMQLVVARPKMEGSVLHQECAHLVLTDGVLVAKPARKANARNGIAMR